MVKFFLDITLQIQWTLHHQKLSFHALVYMEAEENHSLRFFLQRCLIFFYCSAFQVHNLQMHFGIQYPRKVVSSENFKSVDFQIHEACHFPRKTFLLLIKKKIEISIVIYIYMKYLDINKIKNYKICRNLMHVFRTLGSNLKS